jgi:hypothetical protein
MKVKCSCGAEVEALGNATYELEVLTFFLKAHRDCQPSNDEQVDKD